MNNAIQRIKTFTVFISAWLMTQVSLAELPKVIDPAGEDGNFLENVANWSDQALEVAGLIVSGISFLIFSYMLIGEAYKQYQSNSPEYGKVGFLAVLAGITLVGTTFLLTQSAGIIVA